MEQELPATCPSLRQLHWYNVEAAITMRKPRLPKEWSLAQGHKAISGGAGGSNPSLRAHQSTVESLLPGQTLSPQVEDRQKVIVMLKEDCWFSVLFPTDQRLTQSAANTIGTEG